MWNVETTDRFDQWYFEQTTALKEDVLAMMHILAEFGPTLGRPYVDTVKASAYANMKELRIQHAGNPIRAFFAFDPDRKAIVLCAGDKTGCKQKLFYNEMITLADVEYSRHLADKEAIWQR
ncbi:TPA: type II toxin-antitoxin system RelE/ParE family toxin [Enterobacter kobei]|nr:type II toxin-antitoxin system RelE/ParE family toxin [Enterobacter kobei]